MLNIGAGEIALILVVALLVLGPRRLPELARGIGKFMREFRRQTDEVRSTLESEFYRMDVDLSKDLPPVSPLGKPVPRPMGSPVPRSPELPGGTAMHSSPVPVQPPPAVEGEAAAEAPADHGHGAFAQGVKAAADAAPVSPDAPAPSAAGPRVEGERS